MLRVWGSLSRTGAEWDRLSLDFKTYEFEAEAINT